MPMPYLFISSSRLEKRLDAFFRELDACHDRLNALSDVYLKLGHINTNLSRLYELHHMTHERITAMQSAIDSLREEVARIPELKASVDAAFAGLKQQLADALANAGDPAAINAIVKDIHDGLDGLAASVAANT